MRSERLHDVVDRRTGGFQWINLGRKIDKIYLHIVCGSREVPPHIAGGNNVAYMDR